MTWQRSPALRTDVAPMDIQKAIGRALDRLFAVAPGLLDSAAFIKTQQQLSAARGRKFERQRWFCADGQLIHKSGQTYAFSTQWGLDTEATIERLLTAFPGHEIAVRRNVTTAS